MTLEETAKIFSEKWNKDINRTHIASAKRMAQNLFNSDIQSGKSIHRIARLTENNKNSVLDPSKVESSLTHPGVLPNTIRPTDQNRNNEILNHNYDSINDRKLSHEDQFNSGLDLYSQFNLNVQKQVSHVTFISSILIGQSNQSYSRITRIRFKVIICSSIRMDSKLIRRE